MTIHLGGVCIKWLGYGFIEDDMWNPSGPSYRASYGHTGMVKRDRTLAIFLWPSSGPHDQLLLVPDKGHTWAITGQIQGQLCVIKLAETCASYGQCVTLV